MMGVLRIRGGDLAGKIPGNSTAKTIPEALVSKKSQTIHGIYNHQASVEKL